MKKVIVCVALLGAAAAQGAAAPTQIDKRIAAQLGGTVNVSNVAGRIEVQGWDRPEVQVTGTLGAAVERLDLLNDGSHTVVKVILPRMNLSGRSGEATLVVHLPAASRVEVSTVSADLAISGLQGVQALHTVSGDIRSELAGAECEIKTVSGDVSLRGKGLVAPLRVSTVSGDIQLSQAAGSLELVTVSGDMNLELKPLNSLRVRTTSGDTRLQTRLARDANVDIESVSGDVKFDAASDAGFVTEVGTFSGDIDTCFGVRSERASEYGPGSRLRTTVGAGGARVRIKALSGDVAICDK